jgi:hypothetical protein
MNVEIGTEAAQLPEKEYINGISVAVRNFVVAHLHFSEHFTRCLYLKLIIEVAATYIFREQGSCSDWETVEAQKLFQVKNKHKTN